MTIDRQPTAHLDPGRLSRGPNADSSILSSRGPGWHDDPISSLDQDRLGRASFAKHAARLIAETHTVDSSVVYGLEGPWGSGKSSVITMITAFLVPAKSSTDGAGDGVKEDGWRVVPFTPWATSGSEALLAEFFAALTAAVPEAGAAQGLRDKITGYAEIARPIAALIPGVGNGLVEASRTVEARLRKPWNIAFAEVADALRQLGTPILIVVDDIDRLQPVELLDLLRVVRLLGRFPGVDFLLAYDEQTLVETLQDPARGTVSTARARAFMEKIVQYPLSMPPLLTGKIVKMLDAGLTEIITPERVERGFDKPRFGRIVLTTMPSQLATPRAIERFLAQVREQFRIHDLNEMNDLDLILATFLRVQFPDLFAQLQRWRTELTRGATDWISYPSRNESGPNWDELLQKVEDVQDRQDARAALEALFPAVAERNPARAAAGRFAHPDYFDRYLAQSIPEGDIPDAVIARALAEAAAGNSEVLRTLILAEDDEQVTLALSKIRVRYPDIGQQWMRDQAPEGPASVELLAAGMALVNELPDRPGSWTSALEQTTYWMANLLRRLLDADPNTGVDAALEVCTRTRRRAHVVSAASGSLDGVDNDTREALLAALTHEADRLIPLLVADLRLGDDGDTDIGGSFLYSVVHDAGRLPELQAELQAGLAAEEFTVADVAARFVSFAYIVGGPVGAAPSSAAFAGELFTKVTGVAADSTDHNEHETWADTSWARRRRFAAKYVKSTGMTAEHTTDSSVKEADAGPDGDPS
ncbi:P-loop NTPase fold protein [Nocardioides sp. NPDC047086]|uniref:KAP family P-loop NTPase fold protein n=1 Tax=Nocardioides sp. NPDC047086 TaxID=3154810 RepID=UPI0033D7E0BD